MFLLTADYAYSDCQSGEQYCTRCVYLDHGDLCFYHWDKPTLESRKRYSLNDDTLFTQLDSKYHELMNKNYSGE